MINVGLIIEKYVSISASLMSHLTKVPISISIDGQTHFAMSLINEKNITR